MKTTHTFGIQFIIRPGKTDNSKGIVYARVTVETRRIEISLKKTFQIKDWNNSRGIAKGSSPEIKKFNSYLEQVRAQITEAYRELQINKQQITPESIKALFFGDSIDTHTLLELVDYHNSTQKRTLAPGTMKNYYTTKRYIAKFLRNTSKASDIYLTQVTYKSITDFECFLRNHKPLDHHKPIANNGVMKHLGRLRTIINLGQRMGWINQNPFDSYKFSFKKVERGFLTERELKSVEEKEFGIPRLEIVKDLFVFSCYTGLSYVDAMYVFIGCLMRKRMAIYLFLMEKDLRLLLFRSIMNRKMRLALAKSLSAILPIN